MYDNKDINDKILTKQPNKRSIKNNLSAGIKLVLSNAETNMWIARIDI